MFQKLLGWLSSEVRGAVRSPEWPSLRRSHLKRESCCQACGKTEDLEVHHMIPVHVDPTQELNPDNLLTLCGICHLLLGHLRNWKSWNVHIRKDAAILFLKIRTRP